MAVCKIELKCIWRSDLHLRGRNISGCFKNALEKCSGPCVHMYLSSLFIMNSIILTKEFHLAAHATPGMNSPVAIRIMGWPWILQSLEKKIPRILIICLYLPSSCLQSVKDCLSIDLFGCLRRLWLWWVLWRHTLRWKLIDIWTFMCI